MREQDKVLDDLVPILVVLDNFGKPVGNLELCQRALDDGLSVLDECLHDQVIRNFLSADGAFAVAIAALNQARGAEFVTTFGDAVIFFGQFFETDGTFPGEAT